MLTFIEKLKAVRKIITHALCPDGIASAMILRDVLDVPVEFVQYGTKEHRDLPVEPGLLFCDFTPPYQGSVDRTQEFVAAGAIVLDHHKTARACVKAFGENGFFGDEEKDPGVSGAVLAYKHVWKPLKMADLECEGVDPMRHVERFARLAGIRDTWQKDDPEWPDACLQAAALMFPPVKCLIREHGKLEALLETDWDRYLWAGRISEMKHKKACERALHGGFQFVAAGGMRVVMFQGIKLSSDAAEMAGNCFDLVVGYEMFCEDNVPKIVFSMRSRTNFDVGAMAKSYGGGGHMKAAGFDILDPRDTPFRLFERLLNYHVATLDAAG